jgi:hypothetical protein
MKNPFLVLIFLIGSAYHSSASELYARVVQVETNYETVTEYTPVKMCRDEEVPIYGNTGQNNDDAGNGRLILLKRLKLKTDFSFYNFLQG